jgi:hypothetical protein
MYAWPYTPQIDGRVANAPADSAHDLRNAHIVDVVRRDQLKPDLAVMLEVLRALPTPRSARGAGGHAGRRTHGELAAHARVHA